VLAQEVKKFNINNSYLLVISATAVSSRGSTSLTAVSSNSSFAHYESNDENEHDDNNEESEKTEVQYSVYDPDKRNPNISCSLLKGVKPCKGN